MVNESFKLGICHWSMPIDGPYACKIASELGFEGIQLEIGSYERGFPLSRRTVQQAYLELAEQYGIAFPSCDYANARGIIIATENLLSVEQMFRLADFINVKDGKHGEISASLLGEGDSEFLRSMSLLKEIGYHGWIVMENYYDRLPLRI